VGQRIRRLDPEEGLSGIDTSRVPSKGRTIRERDGSEEGISAIVRSTVWETAST
jgi:hypothetical protein